MGRCHQAPVVEVGKRHVTNATTDKIKLILDSNELKPIIPNFINFDNYKKNDGYELLEHSKNDVFIIN